MDFTQSQKNREEYKSRINLVIDYIENNIDKNLTLEELSSLAGFSKFHFNRMFAAFIGETLFSFINRLRVEKASQLLIADINRSIVDIALSVGFANHSVFCRTFKKYYDLTPSEYRNNKTCEINSNISQRESNDGKENYFSSLYNQDILNYIRRNKIMIEAKEVKIIDFPETTFAYVRYIGPYAGDGELFAHLYQKIFSWAESRELLRPMETKNIIIYHDDPEITDEEKLRVSVCISVPEETPVSGEIGKLKMEAGKYAAARFELDVTEYGEAWNYVCGVWLPQSGYQAGEGYTFEMYPFSSEERHDGKMTVDICIPVKPL